MKFGFQLVLLFSIALSPALTSALPTRNIDPDKKAEALFEQVDDLLAILTVDVPAEYEGLLRNLELLNSISRIQFDGKNFSGYNDNGHKISIPKHRIEVSIPTKISSKKTISVIEALGKLNSHLKELALSMDSSAAHELRVRAEQLESKTRDIEMCIRRAFSLAAENAVSIYSAAREERYIVIIPAMEGLYEDLEIPASRLKHHKRSITRISIEHLQSITNLANEAMLEIAEGQPADIVADKIKQAQNVLENLRVQTHKNGKLQDYKRTRAKFVPVESCKPILT